MSALRAIILAAGQGKRMKSDLPKVLHAVMGKAILSRVMDATIAAGVDHVHVVVGHQSDVVKGFIEANAPKVPYSTHLQSPQLGTGHAVMQAAQGLEDDKFKGIVIVTVGDAPVIQAETLRALVESHKASGVAVTALTAVVDDPKNYGRIKRDHSGNVQAVVEDKDASPEEKKICEVNTGIYCFSWPEVKEGLNSLTCENKQKEYYLTDLVYWAYKSGKGASSEVLKDWREVAGINSRVELAEAARHLRDVTNTRLALESGVTIVDPATTWISPEVKIGVETVVMPGCHLTGDIEIGDNCTIGPFTVMKGTIKVGRKTSIVHSHVHDSVIGEGAKIGPFSHLREGNNVGNSAKVGNFVELKKATIGEKTSVGHLSYIGDATLGTHVNIGAGTITANYDHITKLKARTTLGDGASTGSNSVLVAPVEVAAEGVVAAGTVVTKPVPSGALCVARADQRNIEGWAAKRRNARKPDTDNEDGTDSKNGKNGDK